MEDLVFYQIPGIELTLSSSTSHLCDARGSCQQAKGQVLGLRDKFESAQVTPPLLPPSL